MTRAAVLLALLAGTAFGQAPETWFYRARLEPSNVIPTASSYSGFAIADVRVTVLRSADQHILAGNVTFRLNISEDRPGNVYTRLTIRRGLPGEVGAVAVDAGLTPFGAAALGAASRQVQIASDDATGLVALSDILRDTDAFYVALDTADQPGGALRGQLQRTDRQVALGALPGAGTAYAVALASRDSYGIQRTGQINAGFTYSLPQPVTFTSMTIADGENGAVFDVFRAAGITDGIDSDPSGSGTVIVPVEVDLSDPTAAGIFQKLLSSPDQTVFVVATAGSSATPIRAPLRGAGRIDFTATLLPSAVVPPAGGLAATAWTRVSLFPVRRGDGSIERGLLQTDTLYQFPDRVTFTGLALYSGAAGQSGSPLWVSAFASQPEGVATASGSGQVFGFDVAGSESVLTAIAQSPESVYVQFATTALPAGALRAQLALPPPDPVISAVVPATLQTSAATVAPGSLVTLFGAGLAPVATDLSGWQGQQVPVSLSGVRAELNGTAMPLLYVSPDQINAQVPFDTSPGPADVTVRLASGASARYPVTVAAAAPTCFTYQGLALAVTPSFALVTAQSPAREGDVVILYLTGLGQTQGPSATGTLIPASPLRHTAPVLVRVGGRTAEVIYSVASPGFVGLYQLAIRVPAGAAGGDRLLEVEAGGQVSVPVPLALL